MTKTLANETTFPIVISETNVPQWGLTKREYFAAMAMQGILSNSKNHLITFDDVMGQSVKGADELINALNETK